MADRTDRKAGIVPRLGDTRWTLIVRAQGSCPDARKALGELIRRYEGFVTMLICLYRHPPDLSAEELKQEFFTRMLAYGDVTKLDPKLGSFRGFLRVSVRNFLANEWQKWYAARNGRCRTDPIAFDLMHGATAESICNAAFALSTLGYVLDRHRDESEDKARFDVLKRFLPGPALELVELRPFAEALGTSSGQLRTEICRLRKRYAVLLRGAIADTLALDARDPDLSEAIDDEVRLLYRSLCDPADAEVVLQH